jgi:TldD protein
VLVDFPTSREGAGWLKASRSHGCAAAPRAFDVPLIHSPNLTLEPGSEAIDFDDLVRATKKGLAVKGLSASMDFQCLNGLGTGRYLGVYEVKDGKRIAGIDGAAFLFRAPEFWKAVTALGGRASRQPFAAERMKGEPEQQTSHSVTAVPAAVKQVTTIEAGRR